MLISKLTAFAPPRLSTIRLRASFDLDERARLLCKAYSIAPNSVQDRGDRLVFQSSEATLEVFRASPSHRWEARSYIDHEPTVPFNTSDPCLQVKLLNAAHAWLKRHADASWYHGLHHITSFGRRGTSRVTNGVPSESIIPVTAHIDILANAYNRVDAPPEGPGLKTQLTLIHQNGAPEVVAFHRFSRYFEPPGHPGTFSEPRDLAIDNLQALLRTPSFNGYAQPDMLHVHCRIGYLVAGPSVPQQVMAPFWIVSLQRVPTAPPSVVRMTPAIALTPDEFRDQRALGVDFFNALSPNNESSEP